MLLQSVYCLFSVTLSCACLLQAVNKPLQARGNPLDLDFTRANTPPEDYDTDLESAWNNESKSVTSFADRGYSMLFY